MQAPDPGVPSTLLCGANSWDHPEALTDPQWGHYCKWDLITASSEGVQAYIWGRRGSEAILPAAGSLERGLGEEATGSRGAGSDGSTCSLPQNPLAVKPTRCVESGGWRYSAGEVAAPGTRAAGSPHRADPNAEGNPAHDCQHPRRQATGVPCPLGTSCRALSKPLRSPCSLTHGQEVAPDRGRKGQGERG